MSQQFYVGLLFSCGSSILLASLPQADFRQSTGGSGFLSTVAALTELGISQVGAITSKPLPTYSQGSRAMKCAPRAGWMLVGFGVAISLLLAIFVLALANSNRKVWGFSGSKRMPCHRREHRGFSEVKLQSKHRLWLFTEQSPAEEPRPPHCCHMPRFLSPHCNTQVPTCFYFYIWLSRTNGKPRITISNMRDTVLLLMCTSPTTTAGMATNTAQERSVC